MELPQIATETEEDCCLHLYLKLGKCGPPSKKTLLILMWSTFKKYLKCLKCYF